MKKRVLGMMVIAIMVAMTLTGSVLAAGVMNTTPATVEPGDNVTVTVQTGNDAAYGMYFRLAYDSAKFEYVSDSSNGVAVINSTTPGTLIVVYASSTVAKEITLTFKAKAEGTADFVASQIKFYNANGETLETMDDTTQAVTVKAATVENNVVENNTSTNNVVTNNNTPSSYPQAGADITTYVIAGIMLVAIAVVAVKVAKSKNN